MFKVVTHHRFVPQDLLPKCYKKKCICDVLCLWEQNYLSLLSCFYKSISCSSLEMMDAAKSKIKWSWEQP